MFPCTSNFENVLKISSLPVVPDIALVVEISVVGVDERSSVHLVVRDGCTELDPTLLLVVMELALGGL